MRGNCKLRDTAKLCVDANILVCGPPSAGGSAKGSRIWLIARVGLEPTQEVRGEGFAATVGTSKQGERNGNVIFGTARKDERHSSLPTRRSKALFRL